jgi:hypothetical protein
MNKNARKLAMMPIATDTSASAERTVRNAAMRPDAMTTVNCAQNRVETPRMAMHKRAIP